MSWYLVCYISLQWQHAHELAWTTQVCAKPHDSFELVASGNSAIVFVIPLSLVVTARLAGRQRYNVSKWNICLLNDVSSHCSFSFSCHAGLFICRSLLGEDWWRMWRRLTWYGRSDRTWSALRKRNGAITAWCNSSRICFLLQRDYARLAADKAVCLEGIHQGCSIERSLCHKINGFPWSLLTLLLLF